MNRIQGLIRSDRYFKPEVKGVTNTLEPEPEVVPEKTAEKPH